MNRNHTYKLTIALALAVASLTPSTTAAPRTSATHPQATTGGGCQKKPGGPGGSGNGLVGGTITAIDTTAGTITVASANGTVSVIAITSATSLIGHDSISASAIALGDTLDVSGLPVSIQASSVVDNHLTTSSTSGSSSSSSGSSASSGTAPVPGSLHITGVVTALSPPTLTVDSSFSVTLSVTSDTAFAEVLPLTASQLATGEAVVARVSKSKSGTLTALQIDVTPVSS